MPLNAQHFTAAASMLAVGLGVAAVARTMPVAPPAASAPMIIEGGLAPAFTPPSGCEKACADIAAWCPNGRTVNCLDRLTQYEREGKVRCADGLSADELQAIGWCGDSGVEVQLFPMRTDP